MRTTAFDAYNNDNNDSPSWDELKDLLATADQLAHPDDEEDES